MKNNPFGEPEKHITCSYMENKTSEKSLLWETQTSTSCKSEDLSPSNLSNSSVTRATRVVKFICKYHSYESNCLKMFPPEPFVQIQTCSEIIESCHSLTSAKQLLRKETVVHPHCCWRSITIKMTVISNTLISSSIKEAKGRAHIVDGLCPMISSCSGQRGLQEMRHTPCSFKTCRCVFCYLTTLGSTVISVGLC